MKLLVIAGPTATGKTALAAELAHRLDTAVVSVDSRQVYRGLDLGTGKDLDEYARFPRPVPYRLIDIADPRDVYSLFQYQEACYTALEELAAAGKQVAVLAGGTGLYLEAVLRRYRIANVPENAALRESLAELPREALEARLRAASPELAERTDMSSRKRILRGLEIAAAKEPASFSREPRISLEYRVFITEMDRELLRARIDARLETRIGAGLIAEVEGLLAAGVPRARLDVLGMEYREIAAYLAGERDMETMLAGLRHEIHLLAKRQETWFRGMPRRGLPVETIPAGIGAEELLVRWEKGNA
jgi:tRNA dimethylallyltransferase